MSELSSPSQKSAMRSSEIISSEEKLEKIINAEYLSLRAFSPSNLYTIPSISDVTQWFSLIFINGGEYKGAVFKFRIDILQDYPNVPPQVFFLSPVFHPLICPNTGKLNLEPKFSNWNPNQDFLYSVLFYVKYVFHSKEYWNNLKWVKNDWAFKCFRTDFQEFLREVRISIIQAIDDLQDNSDEFPVRFKPFNVNHQFVLDEIRGINKDLTIPEQKEIFMTWFRKSFQ